MASSAGLRRQMPPSFAGWMACVGRPLLAYGDRLLLAYWLEACVGRPLLAYGDRFLLALLVGLPMWAGLS
ncbi:hypothetical protein GCM10007159_39250 [Modicisalibacter luteus]|nr:hypothetical protein GCM10007159_39250 [Halomonas lutea]